MEETPVKKPPPKGLKLPKSLGAVADMYYGFREERLAVEKIALEVKAKENYTKEYLIDRIPKSDMSGVAGHDVRVTVTSDDVLVLSDFDKFLQWVIKNKAYDCLPKQFVKAAVQARMDAGKKVPGIGIFKAVKLGYNKL